MPSVAPPHTVEADTQQFQCNMFGIHERLVIRLNIDPEVHHAARQLACRRQLRSACTVVAD
jgi:hypothetical protein